MSVRHRVFYRVFLASLLLITTDAWAVDVFRTEDAVPATAAGSLLPTGAACQFRSLERPLSLQEAVERTLCNNPSTRQAWVGVKTQAASVGAARAAYLPTVNASWQGVRDDSLTNVTDRPYLDSATLATVQTDSVSLTWTLYDFGARRNALANATALLSAAQATQDATLQSVFIEASKDYYAAQASGGALATAIDVEQMAENSWHAAQERVKKGVAPISDELQAQTAVGQAEVSVEKARGANMTALGTLANEMDLSPDVDIALPPVDAGVAPDSAFDESIDGLLDAVKESHPSVRAARAKLDAALAKVKQTEDEGLPTFSLVSKYSRDNQPASLGLGAPSFPATGHEWYVGFQLTIPLFEGFTRTYQVHQAEAQAEEQVVELDQARQKVALDVWNAYQALETSTKTLRLDTSLMDIAAHSFEVATRRYKEGVGSIIELLTAQAALANAQQQHVEALTQWRADRLKLAGSLGRLSLNEAASNWSP